MQHFMDKLSAWTIAAAGIMLGLILGGYLLFFKQYPVDLSPGISPSPDGIACTADAKMCPDGSFVGRTGPRCQFAPCPGEENSAGKIIYRNDLFGFTFYLPESWKGYTINHIKDDLRDVTGTVKTNNGVVDSIQLLEIHHPLESPGNLRQVIPIMVFRHQQWAKVMAGEWSVGAAPIPPSELGRNNSWIFALPARYNYAFPEGWEEVQQILDGNPLRPFDLAPETGSVFCGGIAGIPCLDGYVCKLDGLYPDAGGICIPGNLGR